MKPAISLFFMALIALCALISLCSAQNVSINLEPINPPIQIPAPGGSFNYNVTVNNTSASPQTFDAWIMVQLPSGSWYGPVLGPVNLTLPAGASISRQRTQPVPGSAPTGTYVYEGRVGVYPSTVWNSSSFQFEKLESQPGGTELWVTRYNGSSNGDDVANAITVDIDENVYITGRCLTGSTSYATIKYSSSGVQQWIAFYNSNSYSEATAIAVGENGYVYVTGFTWGGTVLDYDYVTIKYDSSGIQQWIARYNNPGNETTDIPTSIAVDRNRNVYVTGYSKSSSGDYDFATIKYNPSGVQQWITRYEGQADDMANSLALDDDGNVYVTGYGECGPITRSDIITIKYNASGVQQWISFYDSPEHYDDIGYCLAIDEFRNLYVTGGQGDMLSPDYVTIKYDSSGVQQWVAIYNGPGDDYDYAYSLGVDNIGNVYVTGGSTGDGTDVDYATIKYNSNGVQQWVQRYNGPGNAYDHAYSLSVDSSGNVAVTGKSGGIGTDLDYATIKYNSSGVQQWVARYNGPVNGEDYANSLAMDLAGDVYVTGGSPGSNTFNPFDYCTIKYSGGNPAGAGPDWQPVEALVFGAQEPVTEYKLNACYPNPFNATTAVRYKMQDARQVSLRVYDSAGRLVTTLVDGWREAGTHELTFDAGDIPSGVYFCRMEAGGYSAAQKLMLVK